MRKKRRLSEALLAALGAAALGLAAQVAGAFDAPPQYAALGRTPGPAGVVAWDYATIDPATGRLLLATLRSALNGRYAGEITLFDLEAGVVLPTDIVVGMPHGAVVLKGGLIAAADAASNSVSFFDEATGRARGRVSTGKSPRRTGWHNPDSLTIDPETGLLVAVNHDSGALVLVNVAQRKVVGRVEVGGTLEEAVAQGNGTIFVNDASEGKIAVVSIPKRHRLRTIALGGCEEPTGIAYDSADRLVISVCGNGLAKFVDAASGHELASIRVGKGADGVIYDARRSTVLIAAGESGTLSVIRVGSRRDINLVQTLRIPSGTRLGAVDVASGRVYLPTARFDMSAAALRLPGLPPIPQMVRGTFGLLVFAPAATR